MTRVSKQLVAVLLVVSSGGIASAADITWTGSVDGNYGNTGNWVGGEVPSFDDTAVFGSSGVTTDITLSSNRELGAIKFAAGAPAYTFGGKRIDLYGDNQGQVIDGILVESGVTENQSFISTEVRLNVGDYTVTNNGSGTLSLFTVNNTSGVDDPVVLFTHNYDGDGDTEITWWNEFVAQPVALNKTGAGKLTLPTGDHYDLKLSDSMIATITASAGTLDVSGTNLQLEALASDDAPTLSLSSYVLIDYSDATLIANGDDVFASAMNIPEGYHVRNDTDNSQVLLEVVPEPTMASLLTFGAVAMLLRRHRA